MNFFISVINLYIFKIRKTLNYKNEYRNILKIKFTKSNIFTSIIMDKITMNFKKSLFKKAYKVQFNKSLLFTMSLGVFKQLTKILFWKKKNINYIIMLSIFIKNTVNFLKTLNYLFVIKNLKNNFFFMLENFKELNFKYLFILDRSYFSKIKVKKKTYIKRRFYRKMTYNSPLKM